MTDVRREMLMGYVNRLNAAEHGGKGAIFDECAKAFGWSRQKAIRELKDIGYTTDRAPRSDRGRTRASEEALVQLAAIQRTGTTRDGKDTMHVTGAYSVAATAGAELGVSVARARALLRERRLDRRALTRPSPHVGLRSLHPNHVHQVDPSLSRLYYAPHGLARLDDAQAYKNKADGFKKLKLWRYVLTDHYSSSVVIRYYEIPGENQATLYEFLLYAWGIKQHNLYRVHGVPKMLLMDSGSANTSRAMMYALKALDVDARPHAVENPRAKGQVERHNAIAEMFEARLRLEPQMTVDDINAAAETWCALYNANRIPHYDSRLRRNGCEPIVRLESWLTIAQDQLRELPSLPVCRDLLTRDPKRVAVNGKLFISCDGRLYSLAGLPGVYVGMEVFVQPLLMRDGNVLRVHYTNDLHEEVSIEVAPLAVDENSGFLIDSPVIGEEFKSNKRTTPEQNAAHLDEQIGDATLPFGGSIPAISQLDQVDTSDTVFMPRRGSQIMVAGSNNIADITISPSQAAKRLRETLGYWDASCMQYLQTHYSSGIRESELPLIQSHLAEGASDGFKTSVA